MPDPQIVGRDFELLALSEFLAGGAPRPCVLSGRPGIGKTTLWSAACSAAAERGLRANKQIAQARFVTVHTVEVHLSRAYAKLGVRSRSQLAGRLAEVRP